MAMDLGTLRVKEVLEKAMIASVAAYRLVLFEIHAWLKCFWPSYSDFALSSCSTADSNAEMAS